MTELNNLRKGVLWVVDHLGYDDSMHGAGQYYLNTIPALQKGRFDVTLCVLRQESNLVKRFASTGIRIHQLGRGKFDPLTLVYIIKLIKQENIALIHSHGYGASNFGRLAGVISRIPIIVHAHDEDTNYPWYQALADLLLNRYSDKVIAISNAVKESCITKRKMYNNLIILLHNGIPLEKFRMPFCEEITRQKRIFGLPSDSYIVGCVAKLRKEKGIEYLLKAVPMVLEAFPSTVFLIVGGGPLRKELEKLSAQLAIDKKVVFLGYREDIAEVLSVFDVKVQPSLTEGFGLAVAEAMAMGKPIVASNVGGIREILKDEDTACLVPPGNPEALADKIIYLLRNPKTAGEMGIRAKEESKKYDIDLHVNRLEAEYLKLISE